MALGGVFEVALMSGVSPLIEGSPGSSLAHFLLCENRDTSAVCNMTEGPHQTPAMMEP